MPTTSVCPDVHVLERLLLGQVPAAEAEKLEEHVTDCPRCADVLHQIRTDDSIADALRNTPEIGDQEQSQLVQALIPCLKRLLPDDPQNTALEGPRQHGPVTERFDFLAPKQADDELGRLGSYRVLQALGAGGMGVVFLADDPRLKRRIALKVIKPELVQRPEVRQRFLREAQAVAQLEHENIVTILHIDEANGVPFLTMPLLRGESLEERLKRTGGPLPLDETLRIVREIACGLAAAHDRGLVHRDIKPANVFLAVIGSPASAGDSTTANLDDPPAPAAADGGAGSTDSGPFKVKILDFGLARAVRATDSGLSQRGAILGTPAYMAPEQGRGVEVDHRADLFSLGCVLYRLATGQPPFRGADLVGTLMSVAMDQPQPPLELNPELPPALLKLIDQLLAKKPEERPCSALAVVEAIQGIERARMEARRPRPSRRAALLWTGAALLAACGLTAGLLYRLTSAPLPPPEEPGEVTFDLDEPGVALAIRCGNETEKLIDPKDGRKHLLPPGTYRIRTTEKKDGRQLIPDDFVVKSREAQTLALTLVGELRTTGKAHSGAVKCVAVLPRKGELKIVSASLDSSLGVWTPLAPPPNNELKFLTVTEPPIQFQALAAAPDGNRAAAGGGFRTPRLQDFTIRLWDLSRGKCVDELVGHKSWVQALAFSPDGKHLLSGDRDGVVYLWNVTEHDKSEWKGHNGLGVHAVAFSADGKQALTAGGDQLAIVWDVDKGQEIKRLEGHGGPVRAVIFGPAVHEATTACDDGLIRIWELTGDTLRTLEHKGGVLSVASSPDGSRLLSGGQDGIIRLWDAKTGRELYAFKPGDKAVNSVAFTADGRRAVSGGSDQTVRLWQLPH